MAIVTGSVTVPTGATAIPLLRIPPGICNVTFWNGNSAGTLYVGLSTATTAVNGLQTHTIPTPFFTYMGSSPATLYGTAATAGCSFQYVMSTTA